VRISPPAAVSSFPSGCGALHVATRASIAIFVTSISNASPMEIVGSIDGVSGSFNDRDDV